MECGDDIDSVAKKLYDLRLQRPPHDNPGLINSEVAAPVAAEHEQVVPTEWVDLFLTEMMTASSMDDARTRATRVLEHLGKAIRDGAVAEAAKGYREENTTLKEQIQALACENSVLKSIVAKQHERQKELRDNHQEEVDRLKQMVMQHQERSRRLEVDNYALTAHLKQALWSSSIQHSCSNLDVF